MNKYILNFQRFLSNYKIHFIGWFIFIFYEVVIMGLVKGRFATLGNYVLFYFFNISLFYIHSYFIMPASKMKTRHAIWRLPLFIIIETGIYIPLVMGSATLLAAYAHLELMGPITFDFKTMANFAYRAIYFILFASAYYYILNYFTERKLAEEREKERLLVIIENQRINSDLMRSQHAHLKAQINPHFLFNTLNFIYTSTRKTSPEVSETIMALSEIMRYSIQEINNNSELMDELEQVENLIKLHQIKSGHTLYIDLNYSEESAQLQIIPLLILTLVENMFKHGDLRQAEHPGTIDLDYSEGVLHVTTKNLISASKSYASHHIGLENIKKRLKSSYGDKADIETETVDNQFFYVRLHILLEHE